ncbi:MAG: hypothetical protein ACSLE1_10970 [Sphingobium sp.]
MYRAFILLLAMLITTPALARPVKVIETLQPDLYNGVQITGVDISFADSFLKERAESDAKAARRRAAAGLQALDPDAYPAALAEPETYDTLPFKQMFPLVLRDVTHERGLTSGRRVKLNITLETLKTADAAIAILLAASSDALEGSVDIVDANDGRSLGRLRITIARARSGLIGMAVRGNGLRERLSKEFALELAKELSGRKNNVLDDANISTVGA